MVSFARADHIGRPVFATNTAGVKVWTASYTPFGGVRTTTGTPITARFPGQWFQSESGLHQNWMRDYDPTTGRYLQADPLGLVDGASVYGHAGQSPMMNADPTGQCFGPAAALLPICIAAAWMLYDYLSDDCYTWGDFALSLASNFPPFRALRWTRRFGGDSGGGGRGGSGGGSPGAGGGGDGPGAGGGPPGGGSGGDGPSGPFSDEKRALVEMAKGDKRTGVTRDDMDAYIRLNEQLVDPFPPNRVRLDDGHPGRGPHAEVPHGHVGPIDYIPIVDP
jgi:RHS repeat-associated protein